MIYRTDKIKEDVRICIDQNRSLDALFASADIDSLMLDEVIGSKILEAVERVHTIAPYDRLELGHNFDDYASAIYWEEKECGWVILPKDFLRLVVFDMSDWERPVYSTITPLDPEYKKQRGRVKALRGTSQRPVCAVAMRPEGKVLEFYSCKGQDAYVTQSVYIPRPIIDEDGGVDVCEQCYQAVVYTIAALTLLSCGEADKASPLFEMATTYLGITNEK